MTVKRLPVSSPGSRAILVSQSPSGDISSTSHHRWRYTARWKGLPELMVRNWVAILKLTLASLFQCVLHTIHCNNQPALDTKNPCWWVARGNWQSNKTRYFFFLFFNVFFPCWNINAIGHFFFVFEISNGRDFFFFAFCQNDIVQYYCGIFLFCF